MQSQHAGLSWRIKCLIAIACTPAILYVALIILRLFGLFHPFSVPSKTMIPAISPGDHIAEEGITYMIRNPRRGDIVVFKLPDTQFLTPGTFYIKRVVGLPGDHVQLSDGKLFIDDKLVTMSNDEGSIVYDTPRHPPWFLLKTNVTVPEGSYFLLGDNSTDSLDSRFYGSIPRKDIKGLIVCRYWPPARIGVVR